MWSSSKTCGRSFSSQTLVFGKGGPQAETMEALRFHIDKVIRVELVFARSRALTKDKIRGHTWNIEVPIFSDSLGLCRWPCGKNCLVFVGAGVKTR
jgi:hypothetical protein